MDNNCKNCGGVVLTKNILCDFCIEELTNIEKATKRKVKEKNSWKNQWKSLDDKPMFKNSGIKNPYTAAIIYYTVVVLLSIILFPIISFVSVSLIGAYISEGAGGLLLVSSTIIISVLIVMYFYRLCYFVYVRLAKP